MKDSLTAEEEAELRDIKTRLHGLGFNQTTRDPLYEQFLKAWTLEEDPAWTHAVELTHEQQAERARLAKRIVQQLRKEETSQQ